MNRRAYEPLLGLGGFLCPECGERGDLVVDTREVKGRKRRRRQCLRGHRFTTYELSADELHRIEQRLAEFREWQASMRDLLRVAS